MRDQLHDLVDLFKTIADPTRLQLLGLLAVRERTVSEMAEIVGVTVPTTSHHLTKLKQQSLVDVRAEGTSRWYQLNLTTLRDASRRALETETLATIGQTADLDADDCRIVRGYLKDGRLKAIPSQRKKRAAVLRAIAGGFGPGQTYTEPEVNQIIRVWHDDVATLRRELIMARWLTRDDHGRAYQLSEPPPQGPLPSGRW